MSQPALPPMVHLWVRALLGLSVSVGVGLAPFLGTLGVPLFTPLLSLIPIQLRTEAITLSTAAMSLTAIAVQWNADGRLTMRLLEKRFRKTTISSVLTFVLLFAVSNFFVVRVHYDNGSKSTSFLKGIYRPEPDPCAGKSDEACIQRVTTFNEASVASYWGDAQISVARFAFLLSYVALLAQFGLLVGYLVLKESMLARQRLAAPNGMHKIKKVRQ
jgi:hypothetical protein